MTNFYLSAYHRDPIIRGAIMQSGDSELESECDSQSFAPLTYVLSSCAAYVAYEPTNWKDRC